MTDTQTHTHTHAHALSRRRALALLAAAALPGRALAQGYAGLASDAEGYLLPSPDTVLTFPADHAPHPGFRIEWWYITANLSGPDGEAFGIQWTLFRQAIAPPGAGAASGWQAPDVWLAHAASTSAGAHRFAEKIARGGVGQAGAVLGPPFDAWIDDWRLTGPDLAGRDGALRLSAHGDGFAYDLALAADGPLALHGGNGFSVKSDGGQASHYYSQPWYDARGTLALEGREVPVTGRAWLDREWSSQPLSADQEGWDWFSLRLQSGDCLMVYRLRHAKGNHHLSGSWIHRGGRSEPLGPGDLALTRLAASMVEGREIPTRWRISVHGRIETEVEALNPNALMATRFDYWEGPVEGTGGVIGYMELVGY
ncbi:lipocalin-like domain-containing protein [Rhodovulum sp. DZ06]|uniref:lipocalin-like domain-containing protein n=1 Tax=Rhodovulum sp. DZ06 TaxID=3425126 RepID=UPI003D3393EB